jgi:hypothetical protein
MEENKITLIKSGNKVLVLKDGKTNDIYYAPLNKVAKRLVTLYRLRGYLVFDFKSGDYAITFKARR